MPGLALVAKPDAPLYVPMTTADVWGEVKNNWQDLYSPQVACPVAEYGPVGSPSYQRCIEAYGQAWEQIKDSIPEAPTTGPYNNIVDLVSPGEICNLASTPPDEPFPNLIENPGALAGFLQRSWMRRQASLYCEIAAPTTPDGQGGCFCQPYFVTVGYQTAPVNGGPDDWSEPSETTSPGWGPIGGAFARDTFDPVSGERTGWVVGFKAQAPEGFFQEPFVCGANRVDVVSAGASSTQRARLSGIFRARPFTPQEMILYFGYVGITSDPLAACPFPGPQPKPEYPGTGVVYVPNSPPIFQFPVAGPSCPTEDNVLEIRVVYIDGAGPAGPAGPKGEDGRDGETTMRRIERPFSENVLQTEATGQRNDVLRSIPKDCAFIRIDWMGAVNSAGDSVLRKIHESPNDGRRDEFQLGRVYLSPKGESAFLIPYTQCSNYQSLVKIPDTPGVEYDILIVDPYGVGVRIVDIGYRYRDFRWENPEDIPAVEYQNP